MANYYRCELCGNVLEIVNDGGVNPVCCGQDMTPMTQKEYDDFCKANGKC